MNWLTSVIASFCASSVFLGALFILCPKGNISASVKYVLSLVFLVSVISAAGIGVKKADFSLNAFSSQQISANNFEDLNIKLAFEEILRKNGISFKEITVLTDKLTNGGISINKVIIRSDCEKEKIIAALGEEIKMIEVEVINE